MKIAALGAALALTFSLSGCIPMAMFAQGNAGYRSDFGTSVASSEVNALCLTPKLRLAIWSFEGQFGRKIVMNSGYRDGDHNQAAGGRERSFHKRCHGRRLLHPGRAEGPADRLCEAA